MAKNTRSSLGLRPQLTLSSIPPLQSPQRKTYSLDNNSNSSQSGQSPPLRSLSHCRPLRALSMRITTFFNGQNPYSESKKRNEGSVIIRKNVPHMNCKKSLLFPPFKSILDLDTLPFRIFTTSFWWFAWVTYFVRVLWFLSSSLTQQSSRQKQCSVVVSNTKFVLNMISR